MRNEGIFGTYPKAFTDIFLQNKVRFKDFYTLGPFGKHSYQLNFCTKLGSHFESVTPNKAAEWPVGTYGIFSMSRSKDCPKGMLVIALKSMLIDPCH